MLEYFKKEENLDEGLVLVDDILLNQIDFVDVIIWLTIILEDEYPVLEKTNLDGLYELLEVLSNRYKSFRSSVERIGKLKVLDSRHIHAKPLNEDVARNCISKSKEAALKNILAFTKNHGNSMNSDFEKIEKYLTLEGYESLENLIKESNKKAKGYVDKITNALSVEKSRSK